MVTSQVFEETIFNFQEILNTEKIFSFYVKFLIFLKLLTDWKTNIVTISFAFN